MVSQMALALIRRQLRDFAGNLYHGKFALLKNPFSWNRKAERGMDTYHDIVDWLGGLPYEVAHVDDVIAFTREKGFVLDKIKYGRFDSDISVYLFTAP